MSRIEEQIRRLVQEEVARELSKGKSVKGICKICGKPVCEDDVDRSAYIVDDFDNWPSVQWIHKDCAFVCARFWALHGSPTEDEIDEELMRRTINCQVNSCRRFNF